MLVKTKKSLQIIHLLWKVYNIFLILNELIQFNYLVFNFLLIKTILL